MRRIAFCLAGPTAFWFAASSLALAQSSLTLTEPPDTLKRYAAECRTTAGALCYRQITWRVSDTTVLRLRPVPGVTYSRHVHALPVGREGQGAWIVASMTVGTRTFRDSTYAVVDARPVVRTGVPPLVPEMSLAAPPVGSGACGHEPHGFRKQVDIGFNVLPGLNVMSSEGTITWSTNDLSHLRLVNDPSAPRGGKVLQIEYPAGFPGDGATPARLLAARPDGSPHGASFESNQGDIYTCFWMKRSANWSDNGNAGTKLLFQRPDDSGGINHYISFGDLRNPTFCFPSPHSYDCRKAPAGTAPDGMWHKIESLWIAGTPGKANGIARMWVDDRLVVDASRILMFPEGTTPRQDFVMFWPTYGGGPNPVPHLQHIWIDHLYVSVR